MAILSIQDLSLSLDGTDLLQGINLQLPKGESLAIIGESGSGKTLLTKLMVGFLPKEASYQGQLSLAGYAMLSLDTKERRPILGQQISYMTQNPMALFNPFQRIREHFLETILSHRTISKKEALDLAVAAMKQMRLGHTEKTLLSYPFELSGGMLQRIMLAMLLCLEVEVIILDEPTSALDAYNRENILRILAELKAAGKTIIIVTHDYDLARHLGGQMAVLYQGQIVEQGLVTDILDTPSHPYTQELVLGNPYERLVEADD